MKQWLHDRLPLQAAFKRIFIHYRVPANLNIWYVFGVILLLILGNQVISGIWLMFFYVPTAAGAFNSIQMIMREVSFGWLIRYLHTTGASLLFIMIYLHIFRSLLFQSYQKPRELVWILGVFLFVFLLFEAVAGYTLPFGQLSYWGIQVLTSILHAIPYVGKSLMIGIRGDLMVSGVTLQRAYVCHVILLPLCIGGVIGLHLVALRQVGSSNPTRRPLQSEQYVSFHPYYTRKDTLACLVFMFGFFVILFYQPTFFGLFLDPLNSFPANPLMTPDEIRPLWYLAPFFAMLRAIPSQIGGLIVVSLSLMVLLFLPWLDRCLLRKYRLVGLVFSFIGLGILGLLPITAWSLWLSRLLIGIYFLFFMPIYPMRVGK